MTLMENWIQSYGTRIQAVFAQNDEMGVGAVIALEQAHLKDGVLVRERRRHRGRAEDGEGGRLDATVLPGRPGPGRGAVTTAVKIVRGETLRKAGPRAFRLVTAENVAQFPAK